MQLPSLVGKRLADVQLGELSHEPPKSHVYSDAVYLNLEEAGLSLQCSPSLGYTPAKGATAAELDSSKLVISSIDVYNARKPYKPYQHYPIQLDVRQDPAKAATVFELQPSTTGKELVTALGEPSRKGGGGKTPLWMEWTSSGIMLELASFQWNDGGEQPWSVLTLFEPGKAI